MQRVRHCLEGPQALAYSSESNGRNSEGAGRAFGINCQPIPLRRLPAAAPGSMLDNRPYIRGLAVRGQRAVPHPEGAGLLSSGARCRSAQGGRTRQVRVDMRYRAAERRIYRRARQRQPARRSLGRGPSTGARRARSPGGRDRSGKASARRGCARSSRSSPPRRQSSDSRREGGRALSVRAAQDAGSRPRSPRAARRSRCCGRSRPRAGARPPRRLAPLEPPLEPTPTATST